MVIEKQQPARSTKTRRVAIRVTDELGDRLERAVNLTGRSQSELVSEAIAEKADAILREHRLLELTDRDMDTLLNALNAPPTANAAMMRSITRSRSLFNRA